MNIGQKEAATQQQYATGCLSMVAFYYLLRIGEYTMKAARNLTKQTVPFKLEDATFFKKNAQGQLKQLPRSAPVEEILSADGATLKLDNQKNGWKGVCMYQESTGEGINNPVKVLVRQYIHIWANTSNFSTPLSAYFVDGEQYNLTNKDVSVVLKLAATILEYPAKKGHPNQTSGHPLSPQWWCKCAISVVFFRHTNPKNGVVARGHLQRIYP
ncbi:hypothetical protein ACHAXS_005252 [Conticribra weissflogii]